MPAIKGAANSMKSGVITQVLFGYSHLWQREYTGRAADFKLKELNDYLVSCVFSSFLFVGFCIVVFFMNVCDVFFVSIFFF